MTCSWGATPNPGILLVSLGDVIDSNIGEWKILVVDHNCQHVYVDPCDLYALCDSSYDTFLKLTDTPDTYVSQALKLVRVNATATELEFVTAATVFAALWIVDKYAAIQAGGTPGYLNNKLTANSGIKKTIVSDTINFSIDPTTFPQLLQNFTDLQDVPNSYGGHKGEICAVNSSETGLEFISGMQLQPVRGRRTMSGDEIYTFAAQSGIHSVWLRNFDLFSGNDPDGTQYMERPGHTINLWGWDSTNILRVPKTGVYDVSLRWTAKLNSAVKAFNVMLASVSGTVITAACNCKYWDQIFSANTPTGGYVYFDFSKQMKLYLEKDTVIFAFIRVDTDYTTGYGPQAGTPPTDAIIEIMHQIDPAIPGNISDAGTGFELARYGEDTTYYTS